MTRILCVLLLVAAALPAAAQERPQVEDEIRRLEAAFAVDEARCRERFAVTGCIEDLRLKRRDALAPLRARLAALDDEERRRRAQTRQRAVEAKRRAQESAAAAAGAASAPR